VGVPKEVGEGVVKVTISFPDGKEAKLAPAAFEVGLAAGMGKIKTAGPWKERPR
jgi:hypothetical protein